LTRDKYQAWRVFLALLAMGFGNAVGPFVGLAKDHMIEGIRMPASMIVSPV